VEPELEELADAEELAAAPESLAWLASAAVATAAESPELAAA
jgi:hypothetical protein